MRSRKRQAEVALQGIRYVMGAVFVLGTCAGFFGATVTLLGSGKTLILGALLWTVFLFWQLIPVAFEGYSPGLNFREVARYPVSFRLYFLLNAAYGLFDPVAVTCLLWLASIWLGIVFSRTEWALPAAGLFLVFAAFNLLCGRIVMGFMERFQSTRKGRERMAALLLVLMLIPQLFNFALQGLINVHRFHPPQWARELFLRLNRVAPPILITRSLLPGAEQKLVPLAVLAVYCLLAFWLLQRQLRAVYQGEIYAESFKVQRELKVKPGWRLPGIDEAVSAIIEKELRYLRQNVRLLVLLVYPVILFSFLALGGPARRMFALGNSAGILGAFAGLLALSVSNLAGNTFGMDREGFGRWLLAPLPLKKVLLAKGLTQGAILSALYLAGAAIIAGAGHVSWNMFLAVTLGFFCILIIQIGAGSVISVYWPKRVEPAQMSSRIVSQAAGLASLLVTLPLAAVIAIVVLAAWYWKLSWLPLTAGLASLALSLKIYSWLLDWAVRHAQDHLEEIAGLLGV